MSSLTISGYALISDRHSAALVSSDGSIDWLCMPRFDSPSIFASILDDSAGHWSIRPVGDFKMLREYVEGSMVLRTVFHTSGGILELRDALSLGDTQDPHRLGQHAPHMLARRVVCTQGSVSVDMSFQPRPEYGLVAPVLIAVEGGVTATGGANQLTLSSTMPLEVGPDAVRAHFDLQAGESGCFSLQHATLGAPTPLVRVAAAITAAIDDTTAGWREWSAQHQNYQGRWRDLVHHSGRVLQALSYQPTGAIVAAATTSLPEEIGGERNWDYRFSWVRDASMTMRALWVAACPDEAHEFFDFMATAAASYTDRPLQIMFGIGGEHDLSERTLAHLSGWRDSKPVRVGNDAWTQPQLDAYGELLDAAARLRGQLGVLEGPIRDFLVGLADAAAARWRQPDNGIWEVRGKPRHFVHSKVMCWVALDRAVAMADWLHAEAHIETWTAAAEEIRAAVLIHGWNEALGAFTTQSFDATDIDATALLLPIVGFLPPDDPRVQSTIEVIRQRLTDSRGLLHRYHSGSGVDDLEGQEGTFLLCTFWLAQALAMAGRKDEGAEAFERAIGYINDVGLLAEQVDSATGELLGNFPQAFSHIGLVNAAWALDQLGP